MAVDRSPRARLTRYYKFYEKSKLGDVDRLLAKVGDSEKSFELLMTALEQKYGPEPMVSDPARLRVRVRRFYKHYNPDKLSTVDDLVKRTKKKAKYEERLMAMLCEKYGDEPDGELSDEDRVSESEQEEVEEEDEEEDEQGAVGAGGNDENDGDSDDSDDDDSDSDDNDVLESFESRITRFYKAHAPEKLADIPKFLAKTNGVWQNEEKLMTMLVSKYGPEPPMNAASGAPQAPSDAKEPVEDDGEGDVNRGASAGAIGGAGLSSPPDALLRDVIYCPGDGMPPEYCEYLQSFSSVLPWLAEHCPELVLTTKKGKTVSQVVAELVANGTVLDTSSKSKRGGAGAPNKGVGGKKGAGNAEVVIELNKRQKRKYITHVIGLDGFGVKLKDASKAMGKKFACGATVNKMKDGRQSIDIQGDYTYDLPDLILELYPEVEKSKLFVLRDGKKEKAF